MQCADCIVKNECAYSKGLDLNSDCSEFHDYIESIKATTLREYTVWLTKRTNLPTCLLTEYIEEVIK